MSEVTQSKLEEWRKLCEEATPGPWTWHFTGVRWDLRTIGHGMLIVMDFVRKGMQGASARLAVWKGIKEGNPREKMGGLLEEFYPDHPDAKFIAESRTALPSLIAEVERLRNVDGEALASKIASKCYEQSALRHGMLTPRRVREVINGCASEVLRAALTEES